MLRTFVRRGAIITGTATAAGITGYSYTEQGAGFRREVQFWSKVFPVIADYYIQTASSSPYVKYQKWTQTGLYQNTTTNNDDDDNHDESNNNTTNWKERRKNLIDALHQKHAPTIFKVMLDLKGLYIKLGQVLSVTALPIPEPYRILFRQLQNNVPGHEEFESVVKPMLEKELNNNQPLEEIFEFVDPIPCGAASIGQAHRARLKSNTTHNDQNDNDDNNVIIKVQYPDAAWQVPADIQCVGDFLQICVFFEQVDADSARMSYDEFARQFRSELDYDNERCNLQTVHASSLLMGGPYEQHNVVVPKVYEELCTDKVITMTYLPGPTMEAEAKRQLELLGIDTSGGIRKVIQDAAKDAVDNPNDSSSKNNIVRRMTTRRRRKRGDDDNDKKQQTTWTWRVASSIMSRFMTVDSILWTVRNFKRLLLWSQAAAVMSIQAVPKYLLPSKAITEWAETHQNAMVQAEQLGEIKGWCQALFDVHGHQIFQLGLFNADPHPGNIVLTTVDNQARIDNNNKKNNNRRRRRRPHKNIGLIDYGQCKRLTLDERYRVANLLLSVSNQESDQDIANAFRALQVGTKNDSTEFLATFAKLMFGPFEPQHLNHDWHMKLHAMDKITYFPKELSMVYRTSLLLRGLAVSLQLNFSICEEWKHHAKAAVLEMRMKNDSNDEKTHSKF